MLMGRSHRIGFASRRRMRGQAMAETIIVALFFLVPFFLMIVLIGKFIDMRSATLQAARYVAFERTVYAPGVQRNITNMAVLPDGQLANGARLRFFSGNMNAITQAQNVSLAAYNNDPLWVDQGGNPLLGNPNMVAATAAGNGEPTAFTSDAALSVTLAPLRRIVGLGYDLTLNNYYTANVSATPSPPVGLRGFVQLLWPRGRPQLTFSGTDTLLADGWSASDQTYERCQAATMVPTAIIPGGPNSGCPTLPRGNGISAVTRLAGPLGSLLGQAIPDLGPQSGGPPGFGYIDVTDVGSVPADRLQHYTPSGGGSSGSSVTPEEIAQVIAQYKAQDFNLTSQSNNADGSVTLTFKNQYGGIIVVTLGSGGGSSTTSTQPMQGSPYDVWQQLAGTYTSGGFTITSVKYLCAGNVDCGTSPADEAKAIEVNAVVSLPAGNGAPAATQSITVKQDPNSPGNSIVTTE